MFFEVEMFSLFILSHLSSARIPMRQHIWRSTQAVATHTDMRAESSEIKQGYRRFRSLVRGGDGGEPNYSMGRFRGTLLHW